MLEKKKDSNFDIKTDNFDNAAKCELIHLHIQSKLQHVFLKRSIVVLVQFFQSLLEFTKDRNTHKRKYFQFNKYSLYILLNLYALSPVWKRFDNFEILVTKWLQNFICERLLKTPSSASIFKATKPELKDILMEY